jgi:lysophospholipase L1-like esterase
MRSTFSDLRRGWPATAFAAALSFAAVTGIGATAHAQAVSDAAKDIGAPPPPPSVAAKALDAVKTVATGAGNIFARVPCSTPKTVKYEASLPHVARKLAGGGHVTIVAFGSSSTASYGASSPAFQYPNRLAGQLRRHYPHADITIVNQGVGGEDVPEEMKRLKSSVIDLKPDLVIWQLGTNSVLHDVDPADEGELARSGVERLKAAGADVILMDLQYAPAVLVHGGYRETLHALASVARSEDIALFRRFAVMRDWAEEGRMTLAVMLSADRLHMSDASYDCLARQLARGIAAAVRPPAIDMAALDD